MSDQLMDQTAFPQPGEPPRPVRRRRVHPGLVLGVILWWLYLPFLGLIPVWPELGKNWMSVIFGLVLPGALAGVWFHPNDAVEALVAGVATVVLVCTLTAIGRRGYLAL